MKLLKIELRDAANVDKFTCDDEWVGACGETTNCFFFRSPSKEIHTQTNERLNGI